MIAPNSRAPKKGKERGDVKREYRGILGEVEGNAECGGMVQPSQQNVAPCVKGIKWRLGTRILRMFVVFWAGIKVEVTQEAGLNPRCRRAAIGTPFKSPHMTHRDTVCVFYPLTKGGGSRKKNQ